MELITEGPSDAAEESNKDQDRGALMWLLDRVLDFERIVSQGTTR